MQILAIGSIAINSKTAGFTLLEILLVVVIIGIMSVVSVNVINSQSYERQILNQAAVIEAELKYLCDTAVFENRAYGIEWTKSGHSVMKYQAGDWLLQNTDNTNPADVSELQLQVLLNGSMQVLPDETEELPHVICQADGTMNPFELRWVFTADNGGYYALKTQTPWQLVGTWHDK